VWKAPCGRAGLQLRGRAVVILTAGGDQQYKIFLPDSTGQLRPDLRGLHKGDPIPRLRYRASILPPARPTTPASSCWIAESRDIAHIERPRSFPAPAIAAGAILMGLIGFLLLEPPSGDITRPA